MGIKYPTDPGSVSPAPTRPVGLPGDLKLRALDRPPNLSELKVGAILMIPALLRRVVGLSRLTQFASCRRKHQTEVQANSSLKSYQLVSLCKFPNLSEPWRPQYTMKTIELYMASSRDIVGISNKEHRAGLR